MNKMNLNIRTTNGLQSVKATMIDFKPFKMFVYKNEFENWIVSEFYTGMSLTSPYHSDKEEAIQFAINGYYGGEHWKDKPLAERQEYIQEKMLNPNLEKYGYANQDKE